MGARNPAIVAAPFQTFYPSSSRGKMFYIEVKSY